MINTLSLFISVFSLFCFMIPGFILRKTKLIDEKFSKALSVLTIYVAQGAMFLHSFIMPFDSTVFNGVCATFIISFFVHAAFYLIAGQLFKKSPEAIKRVLRFALIFSNAGYMGIPVISDVLGAQFTIYVSIYIIWFNVFAYSAGRYIYTEDKKYMSIKEAIVNPAVIPIIIGLIVYLTGLGGVIIDFIKTPTFAGSLANAAYGVLTALKNLVSPLTMLVVGMRLADISVKDIFADKYTYFYLLLRLFAFPALVWAVLRAISLFGIIDQTVLAVTLIVASTPAAAMTIMFTEIYGGDSHYAGKLVAVSTALSVVSMPIVALLLYI